MSATRFRALIVEEVAENQFTRSLRERTISDLPEGDVLIAVAYSSLNYKDALSATGHKGVTHHYPHTPGIDAAGTVAESRDPRFAPGDEVIVTGHDLGMDTDGGFGQYIRVPGDWIVRRPEDLTLQESMVLGTAGFTAGLAVHRLTADVAPDQGEILVNGATGGVGCLSVALLSRLGYKVVAATGKANAAAFLAPLGGPALLSREEAVAGARRPILRPRWAGVIDTVGGEPLVAAVKATQTHGLVVACGNAAGNDILLNVFPFILRGITLAGIDSATCVKPLRQKIWQKLATDWKLPTLDHLHHVIGLDGLEEAIATILRGAMEGRAVVDLSA